MVKQPEEQTTKDKIISLLKKGYSRSQLISDFTFAERTVDAAIKEYKELQGNEVEQITKDNSSEVKVLALPAKLDIKQTIVPEYLIDHLSFVDGDRRQTFVDALLVYEAARRSVMEDVFILGGLASAQAQITETQLKVLREAKSESSEVALQAAAGVAEAISPAFEALKASIAASAPNPMQAMIVNAMQPLFGQAMGSLAQVLSRWQTRTQQPPSADVQPGQGDVHAPQAGQPDAQPAPGFRQATKDEIKEAFGE
jgi:hypothetical protein